MRLERRALVVAWRVGFAVAAAEVLATLLFVLGIPSEAGLSAPRLVMLAALAGVGCIALYLAARLPLALEAASVSPRASLLLGILTLASASGLFLLRYVDPDRLLPIYERLGPLLWLILLVSLQSLLFFRWKIRGWDLHAVSVRAPAYRVGAGAAGALLLATGFVAVTRIGLTPDTAYWGEPGVPILLWHAVVSLVVGLGVLIAGSQVSGGLGGRHGRLVIPISIWLIAFGFWMSVPNGVLQNSFYAPITPPAFQPFPYSDAGFYDYLAQSVNIGTAYLGQIPPRPLYVLFLATLHAVAGQDYSAIIRAQSALLALLPVGLYLLGRMLHSAAAGVTIALLATFRELVSLWVSSTTRVANSKMLTTDLPTTLGIVLFSVVAVLWLRQPSRRTTVIAGGTFGLLLLLRTQSVMILPFLLLLAWIALRDRSRNLWAPIVLFLLSNALTVAPWLAHNYSQSGRLAFDDPGQMAVIYSQYAFTGHLDTSQFDIQAGDFAGRLVGFVLQNPVYVIRFIMTHFFNTLIGSVLALPLIEEFEGLLLPVNVYWTSWNGSLPWYNVALVGAYLLLVALGIGAAWKRLRWAGLVPLVVAIGYALSNGVARFSGWRYNLPADWVAYFYLGIGALELLAGVMLLLGIEERRLFPAGEPPARRPAPDRRSFGAAAVVLGAFVFVGSLPWVAKGLRAPLYGADASVYLDAVVTRGVDRQAAAAFLDQPAATVEAGRLLFPRFYRRDLGLSSTHPWPAYAIRDFPRLGFVLLNDSALQAVFPARTPLDFPPGAETIILACERDDHLDVRLALLVSTGEVHQSAPLSKPCD